MVIKQEVINKEREIKKIAIKSKWHYEISIWNCYQYIWTKVTINQTKSKKPITTNIKTN